jgi:hypothetical protein
MSAIVKLTLRAKRKAEKLFPSLSEEEIIKHVNEVLRRKGRRYNTMTPNALRFTKLLYAINEADKNPKKKFVEFRGYIYIYSIEGDCLHTIEEIPSFRSTRHD